MNNNIKTMTQEIINKINGKCPSEQGIFKQPYGIPTNIDGLVIYGRFETGVYSGGNCWDEDAESEYYPRDEPKDRFQVLDLVLEELYPSISYLQYKEITKLLNDSDRSEDEYYGNSTEWKCEFIILSKLEDLIAKWTQD
jgi:hypothetical protein